MLGDAGVEVIEISELEKARFETAIKDTLNDLLSMAVGDKTAFEIVSLMKAGIE